MAKCIRCGRALPALTFGNKICTWCKQHEAAQRGEDSEFQPVMPAPWARQDSMPMLVTQAIFGINVAVFIGMLLSGASPVSPSSSTLLAWGANYGPYTLTGDYWRLLTSCFVHIGIIHIAMNMWCLWSLGALAERFYGRATFAYIYLLTGIGGSLASILLHQRPAISAGASGALFGITGALIASLKLGDFSFSGFKQGTLQSLIIFVGYSILFGIFEGHIDNACHAGGFVTGLVLGALIAKAAPAPRLLPRLCTFAVVAVLLVGATFAIRSSRAYSFYLMRAGQQVMDGKLNAAIPLYNAALRLRPENAGIVHYEIGRAYWEQRNYTAAERELQQALAASPRDEEIANDLANLQLQQNRLPEARQTFAHLLDANPLNAQAHLGLGVVSFKQGDCATAQKQFDQAEQLNPRLAYLHYRKGNCWMLLKQYDQAIAAYVKEIGVSGDDPETEDALAAAYKAKGMTAEAAAAEAKSEKLAQDLQRD